MILISRSDVVAYAVYNEPTLTAASFAMFGYYSIVLCSDHLKLSSLTG
jgi:hypothetical protein